MTVSISAETGEGIETLLTAITKKLEAIFSVAREAPSLTRARHRAALEESRAALERAATATLPELLAEDLRLALRALGRITGRVDVEDLLDKIFSEFCIGK
jgi:tRNA modification GTPase